MPDDHNIMEPATGNDPSEDFVHELRERLDQVWQDERGTPVVGSGDTDDLGATVGDLTLGPPSVLRPNRGVKTITIAAALIVVVGLTVALVLSRNENRGVDAVDQPESSTTADGDTPPSVPVPYPDFGFTVFEVEGWWHFEEGLMWGGPEGGTTVSKIDPITEVTLSTIELPAPLTQLVGGDGDLWVLHEGLISRIDIASETLVTSFGVDVEAAWIDVGVDDVWIGEAENDRVTRIDKSTNSVVATIEVGQGGLTMEGAGGVWIGDTEDLLIRRIDPRTNEVVATFVGRDGDGPVGGFAVGPEAVWKGDTVGSAGVIKRFDPATNSVTAVIPIEPVGGGTAFPAALGVTADSAWLRFVSCPDGEECRQALARIDTSTNEVVAQHDLPAGFDVGGLLVSDDAVWTGPAGGNGQIARVDFAPSPDGN